VEERDEDEGAKIEITNEMIEVGASILSDRCDITIGWGRSLAEEVFAAMIDASPKRAKIAA
jgi:hypothetical protein